MEWLGVAIDAGSLLALVRIAFLLGRWRADHEHLEGRVDDLETWRDGFPHIPRV